MRVHDPEREVIVRLDVQAAVIGFSIPDFRAWHARQADPDGDFEVGEAAGEQPAGE